MKPLPQSIAQPSPEGAAAISDLTDRFARFKSLTDSGEERAAQQAAVELLTAIAEHERRNTPDCQAIVAELIYDLARTHFAAGRCEVAERLISQAQRRLEHLAKSDPARFATALPVVLQAVAEIYQERVTKHNTLAHYQAASAALLAAGMNGDHNAIAALIDALCKEGRLLLEMGSYRQAIGYFTRALRYYKKETSATDLRYLDISIDLAKALVSTPPRRDTGYALLQSLRTLAAKLAAADRLATIDEMIAERPRLDRITAFRHIIGI